MLINPTLDSGKPNALLLHLRFIWQQKVPQCQQQSSQTTHHVLHSRLFKYKAGGVGAFDCGHLSPYLPQPRLFLTLIRRHLFLLYSGSSTWAHMQICLHSDSCDFAVSDNLTRASKSLCLMVIDQLGPAVRADAKNSRERKGQEREGQGSTKRNLMVPSPV